MKETLQVVHISSGDLFRRNLQGETPLGLRAAEYMHQGLLVPDEITIDIVLNAILSLEPEEGFILDGFPRNPVQAQALEETLARRFRGLDKVVHIKVPEHELVQRLSRRFNCLECQTPHNLEQSLSPQGNTSELEEAEPRCTECGGELYQRADDGPEAVQQRLEVYRNETAPVLDFYRKRGLLADVSGSGSIQSVNQHVLATLNLERLTESNRPLEPA